MWASAIAERHNFLPAQNIYPSGLDGALHIPKPKATTAVGAESKHLRKEKSIPFKKRQTEKLLEQGGWRLVINDTADEQGLGLIISYVCY